MSKIGMSRNPERRLGDANTWCPLRGFFLEYSQAFADMEEAEATIHALLDEERVGATEWFRVTPADAIVVLKGLRFRNSLEGGTE